MITRLYVDNFKCLVNFEYQPAPLQLLFGNNGSGKTATFEVLERLREFIAWGQQTDQMFPVSSLTAWQSRSQQTFELELEGNGGKYTYRLIVEHNPGIKKSRISSEGLSYDGNTLYHFDGQDAHLFRDNYSTGPVFPQDWSRSGLSSIPERQDNTKLVWFRNRMNHVYFISINPFNMDDASFGEDSAPDLTLRNIASWYRHLTQDSPGKMGPLFDSLREVIDGFSGLRLTSEGEAARVLRIVFAREDVGEKGSAEFNLRLSEVSPGQKCLIALFMLLHCAVRQDVTLCIDEPDNFVALREIQPWVTQLCDRIGQESGQCLLISHHPELVDLLAVKHGIRFTREGLGPARIKPINWSQQDGMTPSEIVARGWED